jgi:hypothetical protein
MGGNGKDPVIHGGVGKDAGAEFPGAVESGVTGEGAEVWYGQEMDLGGLKGNGDGIFGTVGVKGWGECVGSGTIGPDVGGDPDAFQGNRGPEEFADHGVLTGGEEEGR